MYKNTFIGLDFFEADYFSHHSHSKKPESQDYQKKKEVVMKTFMSQLQQDIN